MRHQTTSILPTSLNRRSLLRAGLAGGIALAEYGLPAMGSEAKLPPVRTITRGPKFHWFGYYDKFEFDPTNRYVLGMEVDFEHRSPTQKDSLNIREWNLLFLP